MSEVMTVGKYPPFQLGKSRFDQATFAGRLRHFLDITDPRSLFVSNARLEECVRLLDEYKQGTLPSFVTDEQLWKAQKVKQAIIHPDTGQKIFTPFRMSGYVPFGSPICVGLLLPNPTLPSQIFWQWINQTHNACVNYSNRNATKETPVSRFVMGYCGAVTSAVGIAVALSLLVRKANGLSPSVRMIVQKFVPFPAVATASTCNVILMRNSELSTGIEVVDKHQNVVGTSKIAARKALKETAVTRMFLPSPILIVPPIVMTLLEKTRFLQRNPRWHLPINSVVTTLSFAVALPVAIAMFPQMSSIHRNQLEKEIQDATSEEMLLYNKGL